jgi:AcrR family transcriptional regulator
MRADAARNRRALLDAALEAFHRAGVTASLDDIAKAAGVGPGTLYRHFPTRDDLVLAVIDSGLLDLAELGERLATAPEPVAALTEWLESYIAQAGLFDGLARTLVDPEAGDDTTCRRSKRAGAALLERAVDTGALRADLSGDDLLDMATAIAWLGEHGRDTGQRARLLTVMVDGLRPHQHA